MDTGSEIQNLAANAEARPALPQRLLPLDLPRTPRRRDAKVRIRTRNDPGRHDGPRQTRLRRPERQTRRDHLKEARTHLLTRDSKGSLAPRILLLYI